MNIISLESKIKNAKSLGAQCELDLWASNRGLSRDIILSCSSFVPYDFKIPLYQDKIMDQIRIRHHHDFMIAQFKYTP